MDVLCPSRFIGQQLSVKTGLVQIAARDGHGGAVSFKKIPAPLAVEFQTEDAVGNDAASVTLADVHIPLKRFTHFWNVQIVRCQRPNAVSIPASQFNGN